MSENVASVILGQLSSWGVTCIFGYIGDDIFYLFDAIAKQNNITFIQVRHEENAALMASAHAKITGQIGICIADGGPGTVHLLNGLADAFTDRVPVVAITGQVNLKDIGTETKQYIDQQLLMSSLSNYSTVMADPKALITIMDKAYRTAITTKSVSHITVPMDVFPKPCEEKPFPLPPYLKANPRSSSDTISGAAKKIMQAKKPVILIGKGGRTAGEEISELSFRCGAGIITTLGGLGAIDGYHPLYIGGLGHAGSPLSSKILNEADLCIIFGANWWPKKYVPQNIPTIEIDINPANIGSSSPYTYGVVGDSSTIAGLLLEQLKSNNNTDWQNYIQTEIKKWLSEVGGEAGSALSPVHPAAVIKAIENSVPEDALICLDTGDNTVWFGRVFRPARQTIIFSGKWRTMGFGLPAAVASKLNQPHRTVVALVGDGGFSMTFSDFITLVKYNLPVVIIVLNNHCLSMEKNKMEAGGLAPEGTGLLNPDFAGYAKICGGEGIHVENHSQLEGAILDGLALNKPVIIDVNTSAIKVPGTVMP